MSVVEVEGIYREDGEIELADIPEGIQDGTRVIVTFLDLEETEGIAVVSGLPLPHGAGEGWGEGDANGGTQQCN